MHTTVEKFITIHTFITEKNGLVEINKMKATMLF